MPDNPPHNALRAAVNRAIANGSPVVTEQRAEPTVTESLEAMIDKHSLTYVVAGLVLVCNEKAAHIRHNWQDNKTARAWDLDSAAIDRALQKLRN